MTTYLAALTLLGSATFFFSPKTEQTRVLTIQKPIVITQERRTPAFYVYQQSQNLLQKKTDNNVSASTFLSQESVRPRLSEVRLSELKLTKFEYAQIYNRLENSNRVAAATNVQQAARHLASNAFDLEKVVFNAPMPVAPSVLDSFEQEPALSPEKKWATLRGKFELRDGVGIVDHISNIRRVEEGQTRELGRIDLSAGTYSIDIESPNGVLVAQIKDQNGVVIGEDRKAIVNLQNKGSYFEGPFIRVGRPASLGVTYPNETPAPPAQVAANATTNIASSKVTTAPASAFSETGSGEMLASIFDGQKMLSSGQQNVGNVSKFSSTIARLDDPLHVYASITTVRMTGDISQTSQFTQKWLDGSLAYIADTQKTEFRSPKAPVLIGRVLIDGQPAAGVQVQIDGQLGFQAIYLDELMIPSTKLTETSTNGYFMYVNMSEDTYEVIASKQNKIIGSQVFIAEESRVAYQNILTLSSVQNKTIRSFDAFTSENVPVDVLAAGSDSLIELPEAYGMIRTNVDSNVANYYVRSPSPVYADINYTTSGQKDYIHIPMIQLAWLNQLASNKGLSQQPNTGVIIGFTMNLNYSAYLAAEKYDANNIAYFDMYGRPTAQPVAGGGFALFNVPIGAREVVLQDTKTEQLHSQVFQVRNGQTYVSHFSE